MDDALRSVGAFLQTTSLGRVHEHHESIGSTNDHALSWLGRGAPHGALVTADRQTRGRGRQGRAWSSVAGSDIYASVILAPSTPPKELGALGLAVAVGLRNGLVEYVRTIDLKWPNDLLIGRRKLAGILCEARWEGERPKVVVGFGINVHRRRFPGPLADSATSIALHRGEPAPGRARILAGVLGHLEQAVSAYWGGGFAAIREQYEPHCVILGQTIVICGGGHGSGSVVVAKSLDFDGALRVEGDGREYRVETGDVWLSPPMRQ